jgi:uncharacterized protein (TIGR03435 family)
MRKTVVVLICAGFSYAQTPPPAFEVASVKPNQTMERGTSSNHTKGLLTIKNMSLKKLIQRAYNVRDFSYSGPDWLENVNFDIVAKEPVGARNEELILRLQTLLIERFKVAVHLEKRTMSGFALVLSKGGPKFQAVENHNNQSESTNSSKLEAKMETTQTSMASFADMLARQVDRPVQDLTALPGVFDLKMQWTPDQVADVGGPDVPSGPTIFVALQEQLGLKLQAQKVTIDVLVVDHAEKIPTEN